MNEHLKIVCVVKRKKNKQKCVNIAHRDLINVKISKFTCVYYTHSHVAPPAPPASYFELFLKTLLVITSVVTKIEICIV